MTQSNPEDIKNRYLSIRQAVQRSARDANRSEMDVTLVVVSKTFGPTEIEPVLLSGHRIFGENCVQESQGKWRNLKARFPDVELHLIGPLQSNKAKEAVDLFDVIETVDRPSIAEALSKELKKTDKRPRFYVQINTGEEPQKAGVAPRDADEFLKRCQTEWGLEISGLMCIPPFDEPPSPHFALLRKIAERNGLKTLSMGMSSDFEAAIQLGATHVRIGSAIFGHRG
mgnify:FL=1